MKTNHIYLGDCLKVMKGFDNSCIDTILTDPPYGLEFMGKNWDKGVPGIPFWKEMIRVAKPGATLLAFGGTRTYHRMACAIEDAGWMIKDCIMWIYGSGFPKSLNIGKAVDKVQGNKRDVVGVSDNDRPNSQVKGGRAFDKAFNKGQEHETINLTKGTSEWEGWGTALKPAYEPILVAMKPNEGTYANNAMKWGVGGLNIDGSRIGNKTEIHSKSKEAAKGKGIYGKWGDVKTEKRNYGRFPANVILDEEAGKMLDRQSGEIKSGSVNGVYGHNKGFANGAIQQNVKANTGGASRFFYTAKASKSERGMANNHPTVKPLKLMEYLCTLTKTPTGGVVLDPFLGSGTTAMACKNTGRKWVGIEKEEEYYKIAQARINAVPDKLL